MNNEPIIVVRMLNAPLSKVWSALTDRDEMKQWYFDLAAFKPEVGFEFQFEGGPPERVYLHLCKVTEVIPGKRISYSWRYNGNEGNSFVTFDLAEENGKTKLTLTHKGLETFSASNPDLARHNFEGGWNHIINVALPRYVEPATK